MKIAILGAESTGKSELTKQVSTHVIAMGRSVQLIPEYLRTWCDTENCTPRKEEQRAIAIEQTRQIEHAPACDVLIADTTALTVAVYSDLLFKDPSLYDMALTHQHFFDATLLMGLDLPWVADGIQRDGIHTLEPVDTALRYALNRAGIAFHVVYGTGEARLNNALHCLNMALENTENQAQRLRNWVCERCSDPQCEHLLFSRFLDAK